MDAVPIGVMHAQINVNHLLLLSCAGKFASHDRLPEFYAWLRTELPPDLLPPADELPTLIAEVSYELAGSVIQTLDASGLT